MFSVLSPPTKLELTLGGKAKEERFTSPGIYILGNSLVNGYPHWLKADESQAIWFSKAASSWSVDRKENLGTDVGGIQGPKGKDSYPNEIKQRWRYADPDLEPWQDAGPDDVIFKAIGTFFKPLLLKIKSSPLCSRNFQNVKLRLDFVEI